MGQSELNVKFFIIVGDINIEVSQLGIYKHHTPSILLSDNMIEMFGMPASQKGIQRHIYSKRLDKFLHDDIPYGKQSVENGDVIVLTDIKEHDMISIIAKALPDPIDPDPIIDRTISYIQNHRIGAIILFLGITVIALGNFTTAIDNIVDVVRNIFRQ